MQVNMHEAKTHFSELVAKALGGERVIIAKNGKPLLVLAPLETRTVRRTAGLSQGMGRIADDFDAALDDEVQRAFE